jgi:hypothetical protein
MFLGYPNLYRYKNTRLESAILALDSASQPLIEAEILNIQAVDAKIVEALDRVGVKKVDEIELFGSSKDSSDSLDRIRSVGRQRIGHISVILGVPINTDYYSTKGYPGDSFSAGGMGPENGWSQGIEIELG